MSEPENIARHDVALHAQLRLFCHLMLGSADAAERMIRQLYQENSPSDRVRLFRRAADRCGVHLGKKTIMHIGVIGATGTIGSRIVTEALDRGHQVTAFSRDSTDIHDNRENIRWQSIDVTDAGSIAAALPGLDVLISGFGPGNAAADPADAVARAIADPGIYARAAAALLTALESHPRIRLIVVGGAASLEVEPGVVFEDSDELLNAAIDGFGLPREYAAVMRGHGEALKLFRASNRLWTYLSPAVEIAPGERTGRFRIGGDQPVMDAEGRSRISAEDAAVAVLDEVELPRFIQRRFTIGY